MKSVKGMGPSTISELLTYTNPNEYILFNKTTILCYSYLDVPDMPKYNYQYTGKKFAEACAIAKEISAALKAAGSEDYDLLAVDYFLWDEVLPLAEKKEPESQTPVTVTPKTASDSANSSTQNAGIANCKPTPKTVIRKKKISAFRFSGVSARQCAKSW